MDNYLLDSRECLELQFLPEPEIDPEPDEPEPWTTEGDSPVTLCIAASCQEEGKPRIVLCTDWKSGSSLGSSQTADKLRWIKKRPNWLALTSGTVNCIESLIRHFRSSLENIDDIREENAERIFESIARSHLFKRKSDCVEIELGVTYEYFRTHREEFTPQDQADIFAKVRKTNLSASLLIVGWIPVARGYPYPLICKIETNGSTAICPDFGAVGEGRFVATPSLLRRELDSGVSLKRAVYQLYESKTMAEIVPSVGEDTSIDIFYPDGALKSLSEKKGAYKYLDRKLKLYGPKPRITRLTNFHDRFLETFKFSGLS